MRGASKWHCPKCKMPRDAVKKIVIWKLPPILLIHLKRYAFDSRKKYAGELGHDGPLYDRYLHMTDDMLGPSPMYIKYSSYIYN